MTPESLANLAPRYCGPDDAPVLCVLGDTVRVFATGADTGGQYALVEVSTAPGGGPPLHLHTREDEAFYVLEGEVTITVGGVAHVLRPGCFAFGPRGVPHRFQNTGARPSRMLVFITPAGFEAFFEAASAAFGANPPDMDRLVQLGLDVGMTFE
jgi:quercetin dioxygenase-like cupin family protein